MTKSLGGGESLKSNIRQMLSLGYDSPVVVSLWLLACD